MIGHELAYLMMELEAMARGLPDGAVQFREIIEPPDNEYGAAAVFEFRPASAEACALDVILVDGPGHAAVGLALDSFRRLSRRLGAKRGATRAALFREPSELPAQTALEMCRAVSEGRIELTVGLWRGRPAATRGGVQTSKGQCRLHGIGGPLWWYGGLEPLGFAQLIEVDYRPWI